MVIHPVKPIFNENSRMLILGSFPSVKSREICFFYGHPQNRFWRVIAGICNSKVPESIEDKTNLILSNNFAVWDVIHSCEIEGSSDSSIKNVVPNDISVILNNSRVDRIFVNGKKAESLYKKYIEKDVGIQAIYLPSTSPANAAWSEDKLTEFWKNQIFGE
ncbi:MAG: DNA-deoxyinosine glycosylase [Oscillospiraceae bacterium]|nr:DNA-deoxyinosine glycosylase [Oscillospiraceae bacterium]